MDPETQPTMKASRKKLITISLIVVVVGGVVAYFLYRYSDEQKARRVVEAHLDTIKSGNGNPYETVDIGKVQEVFINVLDYRYLATTKKDKVLDKATIHDKKTYDEFYSRIYKTYDEYLNEMMKMYGDRATRDADKVVVRSDKYHYEFAFLYDVTITNKLGQQLYKKYIFEVRPTSLGKYGYEITEFYQR